MSTFLDQYRPVASASNVHVAPDGCARFTLLSAALVRLEYHPEGRFEDRASLTFINRATPAVEAAVSTDGQGRFTIRTARLTLTYASDGMPFSADNLRVEFQVAEGETGTWTPGMEDPGNLLGTCRTLDGVSGGCDLEPGLLSRSGWALVDDSQRLLFDEHPDARHPWPTPRPHPADHTDWYLFAHGRDYRGVLSDFTAVAGAIPTPPLYALGLWWSRYWPYSDDELKDLVGEFRANDVPLDVLVIDMDWHLDGWTGYTWNSAYFPDPAAFLQWCRVEEGLRVTLNLHPADGVGKHEHCFHEMAHHLGHDTSYVYRIPFDCADPKFMDAYFSFLHHPMEKEGIDFWWMDWQQGGDTAIPGLDPLYWLNHMHWVDMEHNPARGGQRPLVFSRWGGLGNHRYQIGFSGDTYNNWESLAFQPYFTANAANVGYAWWSHDIGGHQPGPVEDELYTRWIQYGAFSPILRTHCGRHPEAERRIWAFPDEHADAMRRAVHLRYELTPHIYSHVRERSGAGVPLCAPMYHAWPEHEEAYGCPDQYLFTDNLVVAPVIHASDDTSELAPASVWIPPGTWVNWFTGEAVVGPRHVRRLTPLAEIPLWVRANDEPVFRAPGLRRAADAFEDVIELHLTPHADGAEHTCDACLTEDDGESALSPRHVARTPVTVRYAPHAIGVEIHPTTGEVRHAARTWQVRIPDTYPPLAVGAETGAGVREASWAWDADGLATVITLADVDASEGCRVTVRWNPEADASPLAAGLRGKVAQVERLSALLPEDASLPVLEKVRAQVALLSSGTPAEVHGAAHALHEAYPRLVPEIASADLDASLRERALAQLLHLCCDITVDAIGADRVAACADVHFDAMGADVDARLVLEVDAGAGHLEQVESSEVADDGLGVRVEVGLPRHPDRVEARATVALSLAGTDALVSYRCDGLRSINAWRILGPFDEAKGRMHEVVLEPETRAGRLDPDGTFATDDGRVLGWQPVRRRVAAGDDLASDFLVDFHEVFGAEHEYATAYALAHVEAPEPMRAVMALGSDDGCVVWVNGTEVHRRKVERAYGAGQDRFGFDLRQGRNEILVRVGQVKGGWCFSARLQDSHGRPLPVRVVQMDPDPVM
ncbi:MAG: hypothetical protein KDA21_08220 [Phycisphaerales bacterium]|nr:hypothetical protein [Phycisphaerales bacterium]